MVIVAISTTFERLSLMAREQFPKHRFIRYVVSCQGKMLESEASYVAVLNDIFDSNLSYSFMSGFGLSKNRNAAIILAMKDAINHDYIYICDDDVSINVNGLFELKRYSVDNHADFVSGMISTHAGMFKNYDIKVQKLSSRSCAKVSSVEMLISCDFLKKNNIQFDENFGLGARYPSGEEFIFCNDLLSAGGKAYFLPVVVCEHPPVSSGQDFYSNRQKIKAKGAMLTRVYGQFNAGIYAIAFSLKKWPLYKNKVSFISFTKYLLKGVMDK